MTGFAAVSMRRVRTARDEGRPGRVEADHTRDRFTRATPSGGREKGRATASHGQGYWQGVARRLSRDKTTIAFGVVLLLPGPYAACAAVTPDAPNTR